MNCLNCCVTDLALGDCHLIPIDDVTSRKEGNDWVSYLYHDKYIYNHYLFLILHSNFDDKFLRLNTQQGSTQIIWFHQKSIVKHLNLALILIWHHLRYKGKSLK